MNRMVGSVGSLGLALLIGAGAVMAHGRQLGAAPAPAPAPAPTIGSIDMEEVYNASGAPRELAMAAHQREAEGVQRINKLMAAPYLEAQEVEEYGALIGRAVPSPEEEKRSAALKAVNDGRAAELADLQSKANAALNAQGAARMAHLNDMKHILQTQVRPGLVADLRSQQEGWIQEFRHRQIVQLRQEIAKVAKEKGIAHVFDATTLVYSTNDLTPLVVKRVSKQAGKH